MGAAPAGDGGTAVVMQQSGPKYLRRVAGQVLDAMVASLQAEARNGQVDVATLRKVAEALKTSPQFDSFYAHAFQTLAEGIEEQRRIELRRNALGRLMVHPLSGLLNDGTLSRDMLPNLFHFFQLSLGDQLAHYAETCDELLNLIRTEQGEDFTWDTFYAHPDARMVQMKVLWTIVKAFRHFEARQEWFIKLMQYHPSTISLGSHMFINAPRPTGVEQVAPFSNQEFCVLFQALFRPIAHPSKETESMMRRALDDFDQKRFDTFLENLAACHMG